MFFIYAGYPISLLLLRKIVSNKVNKATITPMVSIIIPAFNEEAKLRNKIESTLALEYPAEKKEIIVASDCSTDGTNDIIREYADKGLITPYIATERHGKESIQSESIKIAKGEILVFTDASIFIKPEHLQKIVNNFADPMVGCVTSEDKLITDENDLASCDTSYVQYDTIMRRAESEINSVIGMSGSFFAARANCCFDFCTDPPVDSDFRIVMNAKEKGLRAINDENVHGYYKVVASRGHEFQRKVRTILRGMVGMWAKVRFLNPFKYGLFAFQLFSHKVLRWMSPFFLIFIFLSNMVLMNVNEFYLVVFALQCLFYIMAITGLIYHGFPFTIKLMTIPTLFVYANLAVLKSWLLFFMGKNFVVWDSSDRK